MPHNDPQPTDWYRLKERPDDRAQVCCRPHGDSDEPDVCFYWGGLEQAYSHNNGVLPVGTFLEKFEYVADPDEEEP